MRDRLTLLDTGRWTTQEWAYWTSELNAKTAELAEHEERIAAFREASYQLQFLQQQLDLMALIKEHKLDADEILAGITLGLDASLPDLVTAMTRVVEAMVTSAQEVLDVASPSGVMERISQAAVEGLIGPLVNATHSVQRAGTRLGEALATGVTAATAVAPTTRKEVNIYLTAQYAYQSERRLTDDIRILEAIYG